MGELWFVTGGARSGKSRFAERLAARTGREVVYVATLEPLDAEMTHRIARHRASRPSSWATVEAPRDLVAAFEAAPGAACVLLDCLSLWVTNELLAGPTDPAPEAVAALDMRLRTHLDRVLTLVAAREGPTIVVTNEVGAGLVPESALGRAFRDVLGWANQHVAAASSRAWLLVSGRALLLPPGDVEDVD